MSTVACITPDGLRNLIPLNMTYDEWWTAMHEQFLASGEATSEYEPSIADRWAGIVEEHPQLSERLLHEDLTEIYEKTYYMEKNNRLVSAIDLGQLQLQFLGRLKRNALGFSHVVDYRATNIDFWLEQLTDKLIVPAYSFEIPRIDDDGRELAPDVFDPKDPDPLIEHLWIH
jgi:hypothetical protein